MDVSFGDRIEARWDELYIDWSANCRGEYDEETLADLARSIRNEGLHQAPLARYLEPGEPGHGEHKYELVAGYTRVKVLRDLLQTPTCPLTVRRMTRLQAVVANFEENEQRTDLTLLQEARPIAILMRMGRTVEQICAQLNRTNGWIQPRMQLLRMDLEIQNAKWLTVSHVRSLAAIKDVKDRYAVFKQMEQQQERLTASEMKLRIPTTRATRKRKAMKPRLRTADEIRNLAAHLEAEHLDRGLHERLLAWILGDISDIAFMASLQDHAASLGQYYEASEEGFPNMADTEVKSAYLLRDVLGDDRIVDTLAGPDLT
jgi:ParB/RepB/Spo0J family partition protein